ncbi:UDP-glycosyltransferase UGT5 [Helicoverpa armigera]|uniref:UDP-glycosyltransferase UGT5 n=1 Tax=Helicoverpa armigera TaxID=29058 RepID=UPI00308294E2
MLPFVLLVFASSITCYDAARILAVFPVPSISHQVVFRPLTQALAKRGHEVTVITPDPAFPKGGAPENLTEIDVHFSYEIMKEMYKVTSSGDATMVQKMRVGFDLIAKVFEDQIQKDVVKNVLKDQKYDLLLLEACARPALMLSHVFKVPVILVSSFGPMNFNVQTIGSAWHPLVFPLSMNQRVYNLTNWEKISELWNLYQLDIVLKEVEEEENVMAKRLFGPDIPPMSELKNNVDMLFLNIHPVWEGNRPVPPSVVYMGGMHQKPVAELPKDLKTYLDSSKHGVIYVSFGTNVQPSLLPPEKIQVLIKVFSELPYDVLWKWDKDELPGRSSNIRIFKWLPQSDLLLHPKIKLFVMQGGLQSTDEALTAGVPMIAFPMLGDQWYNAEQYEYHKIGAKLAIDTVTEEQFRNTVKRLIEDESYRRNTKQLGKLMRDLPVHPLENAVWWTEHVLRHGGARHLRSPAANMSWTQYLELELVFTVLSVALSFVLLICLLVYSLWKYFSISLEHKKLKDN